MKGSTNATRGSADVVQNTSGVSVLDVALQNSTDSQPGLMSAADHSTLTTLNTTVAGKQDKLSATGSATTPVYINSSGVPAACSSSLGAAASKGVTTSVSSGSTDLVTSGAVYSAINSASAPTYSAGTGISIFDNKISLATSGVTSGTVGSSTVVPKITVDSYGRVTSLSSSTIYPPTSAGTNGQYWMSDGTGAGRWTSPSTSATSGSSTLISSGAVYTELQKKQNKITLSTSDPSGGSDGDIWFVYE